MDDTVQYVRTLMQTSKGSFVTQTLKSWIGVSLYNGLAFRRNKAVLFDNVMSYLNGLQNVLVN